MKKIDSILKNAYQTLDSFYKKDKSKGKKKPTYGERRCQYPGCKETFIANTWSQKYCKEHQQTAVLEANKIRNKEVWEKTKRERPKISCRYPGCKNTFEHKGNFKYCPEHRGKYYVPKKDRTSPSDRSDN